MKILFITTSYEQKANSAAIRNNAWVYGLIEKGLDVDVMTIDWPVFMISDYLISKNKAKTIRYSLPELKALNYTKTKLKTSNFITKPINKIRKYVRDLIFFPDVCKNWENAAKNFDISNYDLIMSSSDFKSSHFVAYKLIRKTNKKWIQIWGDPWSTDINLNRNQLFRVRKYEKKLLKAADSIIYVSEITKRELQELYTEFREKMYYIPRGYYQSVNHLPQNAVKESEYINIVYTGVLSTGRDINLLLQIISEFNQAATKKIRLSLYGNYSSVQKELFKKYDFIKTNESVDYSQIIEIYSKSDILLFISNGKNSTQIPGKLFDYLGTTKPIICLCSKEEIDLYGELSKFEQCILPLDYSRTSMLRLLNSAIEKKNMIFTPINAFSPLSIGQQLIEIINKC